MARVELGQASEAGTNVKQPLARRWQQPAEGDPFCQILVFATLTFPEIGSVGAISVIADSWAGVHAPECSTQPNPWQPPADAGGTTCGLS